MLAEAPLMCRLEPSGVYSTIKADHCIDAAVWADGGKALRLAVGPLSDCLRRELGEAVEARGRLASEELLPMQ